MSISDAALSDDLDGEIAAIRAYAVFHNLTPQNVFDMFQVGIEDFLERGILEPKCHCEDCCKE